MRYSRLSAIDSLKTNISHLLVHMHSRWGDDLDELIETLSIKQIDQLNIILQDLEPMRKDQ